MTLAALSHFNVWWIGELLNALLRPSYVRWMDAERTCDLSQAHRQRHFFLTLLDRADCYPYLVVQDRCGLWILTGDAAEDCRNQIDEEDFR